MDNNENNTIIDNIIDCNKQADNVLYALQEDKAFVSETATEIKEEIETAQSEENTNEFNFEACAMKLRAVAIDDSEENRVKQATNFIDNEILNQPGSANDMELFIESRVYNHFSFTKKSFMSIVKKCYTGKIKIKRECENKESKTEQEGKKNKVRSVSVPTQVIDIPENVNKELSNCSTSPTDLNSQQDFISLFHFYLNWVLNFDFLFHNVSSRLELAG